MYDGRITDVAGLLVGHAQDTIGMTGVSVVIAPNGAVCGCDVRGSAPGTRETALMAQAKSVQHANAVLLAGGSAFGLAAADGVMFFLEQQRMGIKTDETYVPIVPAAVIYDLGYGRSDARPNTGMGYAACVNAKTHVIQGNIGVGMGATVGKIMGMEHAQKGGVGTASITLAGGATVGALVCVNAFGDVWDGGNIVAGAHKNGTYVDTYSALLNGVDMPGSMKLNNTTIGVVATDAKLTRDEVTKLAQVAHDGYANAISPAHLSVDGDTAFALSYGEKIAQIDQLAVAAIEVTRRAVINAVTAEEEK
ncbi:MAG: P1 family peptidase [Christensenellaceae bacterium]|jgi:L-aminopeptidase/D-esterase-like protein